MATEHFLVAESKTPAEVEQAAPVILPPARFPFFHEAQRIISRDGHIEVAKANYSVPPEYLGRTVWALWDEELKTLHPMNRLWFAHGNCTSSSPPGQGNSERSSHP